MHVPEFNQAKFEEGQAAFARGVGLDVLMRQLRIETTNPNAGKESSRAAEKKWAEDQAQRESYGAGLVLGYADAFLKAIRRVDQQLMNSPQ